MGIGGICEAVVFLKIRFYVFQIFSEKLIGVNLVLHHRA